MPDYSACSLEQVVEICKQTGSAAAWEEFVSRTQRMIAGTLWATLRRWGLSDSVSVEDLLQETYLKISSNGAATLREFQSRHPQAILGYVRATAVSVAHDHCKALVAAKRGAGRTLEEVGMVDPPAPADIGGGAEHTERGILLDEIDKIVREVTEETGGRDREIFWLYYREGMTAAAIASNSRFGLSVKGVESLISRVTRSVRTAMAGRGGSAGGSRKDLSSASSL